MLRDVDFLVLCSENCETGAAAYGAGLRNGLAGTCY